MDNNVHVDPARLRAFSEQILQTLGSYRRSLQQLDTTLGRLGRSWRDEQYTQFRAEVINTRQTIEEFINKANVAREHMLDDAKAAQNYIDLG
jgi:hypothetical protein